MLLGPFAEKYYNIKKLTKQLHRTASTIGFIKKSLHKNVIPTFAKVKGTFLREEHQRKCEKDIMKSHLKEHKNNLSRVMKSLLKEKDSMVNMISASFTLILLKRISKEQYKYRMLSFQTMNKKLKRLIDLKTKNSNINNFSVPVIIYHLMY